MLRISQQITGPLLRVAFRHGATVTACHSYSHEQPASSVAVHRTVRSLLPPGTGGNVPEALEALNDEDQATYLEMVGEDGWCIHYDSGGRRCRIYDERPASAGSGTWISFSVLNRSNWIPSPSGAVNSKYVRCMAVAAGAA